VAWRSPSRPAITPRSRPAPPCRQTASAAERYRRHPGLSGSEDSAHARPLAMGKGGIAQVFRNKTVPPRPEHANTPIAPPNELHPVSLDTHLSEGRPE
jgi:hypothetical protein